ncbi:hypothetical protein Ancab_038165 [Ancistrocladus abbreviatus]
MNEDVQDVYVRSLTKEEEEVIKLEAKFQEVKQKYTLVGKLWTIKAMNVEALLKTILSIWNQGKSWRLRRAYDVLLWRNRQDLVVSLGNKIARDCHLKTDDTISHSFYPCGNWLRASPIRIGKVFRASEGKMREAPCQRSLFIEQEGSRVKSATNIKDTTSSTNKYRECKDYELDQGVSVDDIIESVQKFHITDRGVKGKSKEDMILCQENSNKFQKEVSSNPKTNTPLLESTNPHHIQSLEVRNKTYAEPKIKEKVNGFDILEEEGSSRVQKTSVRKWKCKARMLINLRSPPMLGFKRASTRVMEVPNKVGFSANSKRTRLYNHLLDSKGEAGTQPSLET